MLAFPQFQSMEDKAVWTNNLVFLLALNSFLILSLNLLYGERFVLFDRLDLDKRFRLLFMNQKTEKLSM